MCSSWLVALLLFASPSRADGPVTLRFGTDAPEGTSWAREMNAFARQVERETHGQLIVRWYFGGIAGDELKMGERVRRGQLDGVGSAGMLCQNLAPSLRVLFVPGLIRTRSESAYVVGQLKATLDAEFAASGYVGVGLFSVGPSIFFTRSPISSMEDLRRVKIWIWDLDEVQRTALTAMGLQIVPLPLEMATPAYDSHRADAFFVNPAGALAFQWSAQARYLLDLRTAQIVGCGLIANRAFDALPLDQQRILRAALAKAIARMDVLEKQQDDALLGGLFERQGLHSTPISSEFRSEFFTAARDARSHLGGLVPAELIDRVTGWLADFRAEHSLSN